MTTNDSDSDSDSDSPCDYQSPDPSDIEDDGTPEREIFQFTRKLSDRVGKSASTPSTTTITNTRCSNPSKKSNKLIENKLSHLEHKKQVRNFQQRLKRKRDSLDSDDEDSDDDCNVELKRRPVGNSTTNNNGVQEISASSFTSRTKSESAPSTETIDLLSSAENSPAVSARDRLHASESTNVQLHDSASMAPRRLMRASAQTEISSDDNDSDVEYLAPGSFPPAMDIPPETAAALRRAQESKARLQQAQQYKANDIHVYVTEPDLLPTAAPLARSTADSKATGTAAVKKAQLGQSLKLVCRCEHLFIDGEKVELPKEKQKNTFTIRENELISVLITKFCAAHKLSEEAATISITFDGETLAASSTPAAYDLEDDYILDFSASGRLLE